MKCTICENASKTNSFTVGCPYLVKDNCFKHAKSHDHKNAIQAQIYGPMLMKAVGNVNSKERASVHAAMTNIYYMAKKNLPNCHFPDLNWLCMRQGCTDLKGLKVDKHTNYEHSDSVKDFQEAMKLVIDEQIILDLKDNECFGVLIDEMSDISMDKTLIVYLRYLVNGQVTCRFFHVVALSGCSAADICEMLLKTLEVKGVPAAKIFAMSTEMQTVAGVNLQCFLDNVPGGKMYLNVSEEGLVFTQDISGDIDGVDISYNQNSVKSALSTRKKYLDALISNLKNRFDCIDILTSFQIFLPKMLTKMTPEECESHIDSLCNFYGSSKCGRNGNFDAIICIRAFREEWPDVKNILISNYNNMSFAETWEHIQILCIIIPIF